MTEGAYTYRYPRPGLTVDTVIVAEKSPQSSIPHVLLVLRKYAPCKGAWALPGGFVEELEDLQTAAERELQEETSVNPKDVLLQQIGAYGTPGRDPRGWTVTVGYVSLVPSTELGVKAADDAADAKWFPVNDLPALAFDHQLLLRDAFGLLRAKTTGQLAETLAEGVKKLDYPWVPPPKE